MSAQDYYGGSRQNTHTPKRSSQYLSTPLVDQAGYYPELDRPRSSSSNRASRSPYGNGYSHTRSRSTGPPGSDAKLGTGQEGERGFLSTVGGGAAGGYAGKKFLGGKLGAVAGALGGAVVANKLEHRLSGSHHGSSSHHSHHGHHHHHHGPPPPPPPPHHFGHHHGPPPPPYGHHHHGGPPHHGSHHSSGGFGGLVGSLMGRGKHHGGHHGHHEHHGHHGHHGGPGW
ncbi:uncharacterized protein CTRU02_202882 [Colletotrichum truncatum]|uniref:Uncharacterized protein n=1 Tax=Colletotrichum truncatum TaxID=5467 RepID=A0ACC3ZLK4_COLTU|nr:uncharacterized protein CTRU02_12975 [Colletotrichum truncatum]KAF6783959.1 hypothetical protein CTRU02_12975 [Colletotrichum truncatum]